MRSFNSELRFVFRPDEPYTGRAQFGDVTLVARPFCFPNPLITLQHAFSGKSKPKVVTVNFVSRKGAMQLSWGGKSGVPLETIFGVTKGIKTEVRGRVCVGEHVKKRLYGLISWIFEIRLGSLLYFCLVRRNALPVVPPVVFSRFLSIVRRNLMPGNRN